jgi:hypothetical protein
MVLRKMQMRLTSAWDTLSKAIPALLFLIFSLCPAVSGAEVFYAQDEALTLAFPEAERIEKKTFILTDSQHASAQKAARAKIESKLFTFHIGFKEGEPYRYAAIDTHTVRTHPETFMVVLSPGGEILETIVLAFHEPPEYLPGERWLEQFHGESDPSALWPGKEIAGIFGSTLTANATSSGIRKVLTLYKTLIQQSASATEGEQ